VRQCFAWMRMRVRVCVLPVAVSAPPASSACGGSGGGGARPGLMRFKLMRYAVGIVCGAALLRSRALLRASEHRRWADGKAPTRMIALFTMRNPIWPCCVAF
jgi:hypothetical protein